MEPGRAEQGERKLGDRGEGCPAPAPPGGRAWKGSVRGKGKGGAGKGGPPDLQGRQAHLRLISASQSVDLVEFLPEAIRVTGCEDGAEPWAGERKVR